MIYLFLTIICSSCIALILKQSDSNKGNPLVLLAANYFVCTIVSFIYLIRTNIFFDFELILFGVILGGLFVITFFSFAKAVSLAGTALATVSSRLSVIVPIIFTFIIFSESPNFYQFIGIILAFCTILLFYFSLKENNKNRLQEKKNYIYLLVVLVGIGINDFCLKIFEHHYTEEYKSLFLVSIFFSAFLYTAIILLIKKIKPDTRTLILGSILGVPNVYSTYFLIAALGQLPAIIVYPSTNIGIIVVTTFLATMIFKESLNKYAHFSLAVGIVSIVLLTL